MILHCVDLINDGPVRYDDAHALQRRILQSMIDDESLDDRLILLEHTPVLTVGRGGSDANILADAERLAAESVAVREVERGGDVTVHGPGQLVAYPMIRLRDDRRDLHRYLRDLEAVLIETLAAFEIVGGRREGLTGVWVANRKIASIGVAVKRWITWHGIALNVAPDMAHFELIRPCGLDDVRMTCIRELRTEPVTLPEVATEFLARFLEQFGYASQRMPLD